MPKILIVDDEFHTRLLLEQILEDLEEEGVELFTADNGESALEIITREVPEIVFLDVMMPKLNGFDVCSIVKNDLALKGVYIVLLTVMGTGGGPAKGGGGRCRHLYDKTIQPRRCSGNCPRYSRHVITAAA